MRTSNPSETSAELEPRSVAVRSAVAVILALVFAVALVLQRAAAPTRVPEDPFSAEDGTPAHPDLANRDPGAPTIDASQLSFPSVLAEADERANADSMMPVEMMMRVPAALAAVSVGRAMPHGRQDPLLVAAMRAPAPRRAAASEGRPGEFTLHVISFDRSDLARTFAAGLRAKGHAAFIVTADVPERGRSFRVRIGPFSARQQAEAYRRKFEAEEQMNTVVLRETQAAVTSQP